MSNRGKNHKRKKEQKENERQNRSFPGKNKMSLHGSLNIVKGFMSAYLESRSQEWVLWRFKQEYVCPYNIQTGHLSKWWKLSKPISLQEKHKPNLVFFFF